jgi:hypothetical protein
MARRSGDMGGNLGRQSNPLGKLTPFSTGATNSAQVSQALSGVNLSGAAVWLGGYHGRRPPPPAAKAPRHIIQQPSAVQPLHGKELGSKPFRPNGCVLRWPLARPYGPQTQRQQLLPPCYQPAPRPVGPSVHGSWRLPPLLPEPYWSRGGAPAPVVSGGYGATGRAPRLAAGGSAQLRVTSAPQLDKAYLRENGVSDPALSADTVDNKTDDFDAMLAAFLADGPADESGQVESGDPLVGVRENGLPRAVAASCRSGLTREQLGLGAVRVPEPSFGGAGIGGGRGYRRAASAERKSLLPKELVPRN